MLYHLLKVSRCDFIVPHYGMRKYLTIAEWHEEWAGLTAIQRYLKVKRETHWTIGVLFHGEIAWEIQILWFVFLFHYDGHISVFLDTAFEPTRRFRRWFRRTIY